MHGRTMAQAFSSALDSAFSLDSDVDHLSQTIDQKYVGINKSRKRCPPEAPLEPEIDIMTTPGNTR